MKIRMRHDVYRWVGYDNEKYPEISLKKGSYYPIRKKNSIGVYTVRDEKGLSQLVIVPYEGRVYSD